MLVSEDMDEEHKVTMGFTCFRCFSSINGDMKRFFRHLKYVHHITSGSATKIICHQNGCLEKFSYCSSFKRHLISAHYRETESQSQDETETCEDGEFVNTTLNENEESENSEASPDERLIQEDPREHIELFIKTMMSSAVPSSFIQNVLSEVEELLSTVLDSVGSSINSILNSKTASDNNACFEDVKQRIQAIKSSFNGFRTQYQRDSFFRKEGLLIPPEEKLVGRTFISQTASTTGEIMQVEKGDTYQYVPLEKNSWWRS